MKFEERFNINVDSEEAQRRFVNRIWNKVFLGFYLDLDDNARFHAHHSIASAIGERFHFNQTLDQLIPKDFLVNLRALEGLFAAAVLERTDRERLGMIIEEVLSASEFDLNISWSNGQFLRKGASLLDQALVNDVLIWLRKPGFETVLLPYRKGLSQFLRAHSRSELLSDVVTDMYEAVEALAKLVTGRAGKDLSGNREMFLSVVKASDPYKVLLKNYIDYANYFRHAESPEKPRPELTEHEVESFIYLTGLFIRLVTSQP